MESIFIVIKSDTKKWRSKIVNAGSSIIETKFIYATENNRFIILKVDGLKLGKIAQQPFLNARERY